jgi:hypothetical protein
VLAKEVLRTDLYERPSGRNYIYVKFRCKRCKRMGETFVAENRWDWSIFEPNRNEMSERERDQFAGRAPVTVTEILDFHRHLQTLDRMEDTSAASPGTVGLQEATESQPSAAPPERPVDAVGGVRQKDSKGDEPAIPGSRRARGEDARNSKAKNSKDEPPSETPPPA